MADTHEISDETVASIMDGLPPFVDAQTNYAPDVPANFWNVTPSGNTDLDFALGQIFGDQAVAYSLRKGLPILIARTLESMIRNGRLGAIEAGFLSVIASKATVGAQN